MVGEVVIQRGAQELTVDQEVEGDGSVGLEDCVDEGAQGIAAEVCIVSEKS